VPVTVYLKFKLRLGFVLHMHTQAGRKALALALPVAWHATGTGIMAVPLAVATSCCQWYRGPGHHHWQTSSTKTMMHMQCYKLQCTPAKAGGLPSKPRGLLPTLSNPGLDLPDNSAPCGRSDALHPRIKLSQTKPAAPMVCGRSLRQSEHRPSHSHGH